MTLLDTVKTITGLKKSEKNGSDADMKNLNILFAEAKKIKAIIEPYREHGGADFFSSLKDDFILLSHECIFADDVVCDEEWYFFSMVMMCFDAAGSSEISADVKRIFANEEFPFKEIDTIERYKKLLFEYIAKNEQSWYKENFQTLGYIKKYSAENGTSDFDSIAHAMYNFAQCCMKADGTVTDSEAVSLKKTFTYLYQSDCSEQFAELPNSEEKNEIVKEETIEDVMVQINSLIGLKKIKDEIQTLINLIKVKKERQERNLPAASISLHTVFYGPPGTGKTTVARLLGKVYKCLGLLEHGHIIETDRAGLVAGYVGQTAAKTDDAVTSAMGGVLFIDEAYTLAPDGDGNDFGQEAIDTLLKRMEDCRENFVVIAAGYKEEMNRFITSNPGLKSRFSRYLFFDDYTPDELVQILECLFGKAAYTLTDTAKSKALLLITALHEMRDASFGNGRLARTIFEKVVEKQANRIAGIAPLSDEILCSITGEDIPGENECASIS